MNSSCQKRILLCVAAFLQTATLFAQQYILDMLNPTYDTAQVALLFIDTIPQAPGQNSFFAPQVAQSANNSSTLDKTRIVGDVPYELGTTITGQVELTIPIETFASQFESAPRITLRYNSQFGLSCMGNGWEIDGLSRIEPSNKNYFTDGNTDGKKKLFGPWELDGNRLIYNDIEGSTWFYLSQFGNLRVARELNGNGAISYTAFLPNGVKRHYTVNNDNSVWCINKETALDGKEITYTYCDDDNLKLITRIDYGEGRALNFVYENLNDYQTRYVDGSQYTYHKKLSQIEVTSNNRMLRRYLLTYRDSCITSPLTQVDMTDSIGQRVNPLCLFYQGDNAQSGTINNSAQKALSAHFRFNDDPRTIRSQRGKLDGSTDDDAIIIFPNKNSYYKDGYHKVKSSYNQNDEIAINYDLRSYITHCYDTLKVGKGFVNAFCMDVDGLHGDEFVKVNQTVDQSKDHVIFSVFKRDSTGLTPVNTIHRFLEPLVRNSHKSIWPSVFLTGDFTGDGKEEVLLCRSGSPLNHEEDATMMMIDLEQGSTLYSGNLDAFQLYIPGKVYSDDTNYNRALESDRLFATDLDGDGKLEMCVLTGAGLDIYRFRYNNTGAVAMTKSASLALNSSQTKYFDVEVGDMNGDGNTDIILLPLTPNQSVVSYLSKGDGTFAMQTIGVQSDEKTDFMCFDFDQDGNTDIIRNFKKEYVNEEINGELSGRYSTVYAVRNGSVHDRFFIERFSPTLLVPISQLGHSSNVTVMSINANGLYKGVRCAYPMTMDALMTGVTDSRGRTTRMVYRQLYPSNCYSADFSASFPYTTYVGGAFVCSQMTKSSGGNTDSDVSYQYSDATDHRQGLGFCGFRSITATDELRDEVTVQTFSPENFGAPVSITSPRESLSFSNQSVVSDDKRIQVLTTGETSTDLITGVVSTSEFTHDPYGNVLTAVTSAGGWTKTITNTYHNIGNDSTWIIGLEAMRTETVSHNDSSVTNGLTTRYNASWMPDTVITWRGSGQNAVSTRTVGYDGLNRPTLIKTRPYNGTELKRSILYTGDCRPPTGIIDEKNMYHHVAYGDFGITTSTLSPNMLDPVNIDSLSLNPLGPRGGLEGQNEVNGGGGSTFIEPLLPVLQNISASCHYDPFGRQDSVSYSDGTVKTVSRHWAGEECPTALIMEESMVTGQPPSRVWVDAQGRKVRTSTQRFDGSWSNVFYEYDNLGRLSRESMPTLGTSPSKWMTYTYDGFDRVTETEYPDGHSETFSYNGLSTTSTTDGTTSTRTLDAVGNLVEVNDGGGRIEYTLRPDGQPSEVRVGGVIATTFEYDQYGRRTAINDPSAGRRTTAYDGNGNVSCETDARGQSVTSVYNAIGLLTALSSSDGQSVTVTYDLWNAPVSMTAANGHSKSWSYNNDRRLASETVDGFKKTFTYDGNQVSSVGYSLNNAYICSENYRRSNGHLTAITLNTGDTIWTLRKQNARFRPIRVGTGKLERTFAYDDRGHATTRMATRAGGGTVQDLIESYDDETGNMSYRADWKRDIWDTFDYDGMNRLTEESTSHYGNSPLGGQETFYDGKGNILERTDAGNYSYGASLPYAVSGLSPSVSSSVPLREQYLHFNAMQLPDTISENGYTATFSYHGDKSRATMNVTGPDGYRFSCGYYDHRYNEFSRTVGGVTTRKSVLWLGGTPYDAPAALLKDYGQSGWQVVQVLRDNLGSITHVVDTAGTVLQEMAYTAWGQLRDPLTGSVYAPDSLPELLLGRGYTGHEHLPWFGLVNMNARLYDPALGCFLSPDPIVQAPDNTQNFNRYAYCLNNPLRYTDPDGRLFLFTAINAITDLIINVANHGFNVSQYNWCRTINSWKIDKGMYKGSFIQILNKKTWGIVNSFVGNYVSEIYNLFGAIDQVTDMDGMLALSGATTGTKAFTIGHYSLGPKGYIADWRDNLFVHEYGHYIQGQRMGLAYPFVVAIPSLLSAWRTSKWVGMKHTERWFEVNASILGAKHFYRHYGRDENGNKVHDANHFDYDAFIEGIRNTPYINPRTGLNVQDVLLTTSYSKIVFWDFFL